MGQGVVTGSSDCLNSWTRHHASPQNAACVVSGKATRPIRATGSWKLPVVWQGPKACIPHVFALVDCTLMYRPWLRVKNGHQKDMCFKETKLFAQNL